MEHSGLHPEFGLFSPTPRLRRELRIAAISLLFGGIAGALCVSGVVALRHSDNAATEIAEAPHAAASQESEPGTGPSADARAASPESYAGTAAPPQASAEAPAQRSERDIRAGRRASVRHRSQGTDGADPESSRQSADRATSVGPQRSDRSGLAAAGRPAPVAASRRRRARRQRCRGRRAGESCCPIRCQRRHCQFVAAEEEAKDGSRCLSAQ